MRMNKLQAEQWKQRSSGEMFIKDEVYFRHSDLFLENHTEIKNAILSVLNGQISEQDFYYNYVNRKKPYYKRRIAADSLNKGVRNRFKESELDFKYEVTFDEGVFLESPQTAGFDFAYIDNKYNLVNFRNFCFGRRAIFEGEELWEKELNVNPLWKDLSDQLNLNKTSIGLDMEFKKQTPTVLGEIQFGNWALVYRDVLKVIQVERDEDVDLFIYITASGKLANAISDGTVNFSKTKNIFEQYKNILSMPVWLIGLDVR